jgi:hypothetical protein
MPGFDPEGFIFYNLGSVIEVVFVQSKGAEDERWGVVCVYIEDMASEIHSASIPDTVES